MKEPYSILKYPLSTEKSFKLMESENKLVFIVDRRAKKQEIKDAFEKLFKAKVLNINTLIDSDGKKKAFIKISNETPAIDIATQLGMM